MQSFSSVLRRYYLRVFVSNLLGQLAIFLVGGIILTVVGLLLLSPLIKSGALDQLMKMNENNVDPAVLIKVLKSMAFGTTVIVLVMIILGTIWTAGIVGSSVVAVCHDQPSIGSFFSQGFRFFFKMLGLSFLLGITFIPAVILFFIFMVCVLMNKSGMAITFLLLTAIVVATIYMMFMFAPYIMIADNEKVFRSINHAFRLFRQRFGYVFLTGLGVFGVMFVHWITNRAIDKIFGQNSMTGYLLGLLLDTILYTFSNLFIAYRYQNRLRGELYPGSGPTANANWQGYGHQTHGDLPSDTATDTTRA